MHFANLLNRFATRLSLPLLHRNTALTWALSDSSLTWRVKSGSNLDTIGKLSTGYLKGQNISLVAKGDSVTPTRLNSPIT